MAEVLGMKFSTQEATETMFGKFSYVIIIPVCFVRCSRIMTVN
jgi:hypothetical protein